MKKRIEEWLVERGLAKDLELARSLVMEGRVFLGQERVRLASQLAEENAELSLREKPRYASRGGYKLERAMEAFSLRLEGLRCLDVGSSTGGFTDCMLQNGAARVYAIDVGYGLLDYRLRQDARVRVLERTNARRLSLEQIDGVLADFASMDVSFISVKTVLPAVCSCLREEARLVLGPNGFPHQGHGRKHGVFAAGGLEDKGAGRRAGPCGRAGNCMEMTLVPCIIM